MPKAKNKHGTRGHYAQIQTSQEQDHQKQKVQSGGIEAAATRQSVLGNNQRSGAATTKPQTTLATVSQSEAAALENVARCLTAAGNLTRLQMLEFCLGPQKFSAIVRFFRMNPASFKFHEHLLQSEGLLTKEVRGHTTSYRTTTIGKLVLDIVQGPLRRTLGE